MTGDPLLLLHVTAGTAGLLLAPVWLVAQVPIAVAKRRLHAAAATPVGA